MGIVELSNKLMQYTVEKEKAREHNKHLGNNQLSFSSTFNTEEIKQIALEDSLANMLFTSLENEINFYKERKKTINLVETKRPPYNTMTITETWFPVFLYETQQIISQIVYNLFEKDFMPWIDLFDRCNIWERAATYAPGIVAPIVYDTLYLSDKTTNKLAKRPPTRIIEYLLDKAKTRINNPVIIGFGADRVSLLYNYHLFKLGKFNILNIKDVELSPSTLSPTLDTSSTDIYHFIYATDNAEREIYRSFLEAERSRTAKLQGQKILNLV